MKIFIFCLLIGLLWAFNLCKAVHNFNHTQRDNYEEVVKEFEASLSYAENAYNKSFEATDGELIYLVREAEAKTQKVIQKADSLIKIYEQFTP